MWLVVGPAEIRALVENSLASETCITWFEVLSRGQHRLLKIAEFEKSTPIVRLDAFASVGSSLYPILSDKDYFQTFRVWEDRQT